MHRKNSSWDTIPETAHKHIRMKTYLKTFFFSAITLLMTASCGTPAEKPETIGTMPQSEDGYQLGVSACYAATGNNCILLAGGCNFPDTPAADGGKKRYYKGIYHTSTNNSLEWKMVGELPESSAYGVSLQYGNHLVIAGGMNEEGASKAVYKITYSNGKATTETLPPLPCTIDNACGAVSKGRIFVVGGNADGKASTRFFTLDIENASDEWQELTPFPGNGRVQPVCAATEEALYLWGGFTPKDSTTEAKVHCNGYKYDLALGSWTPLPAVTDEEGEPLTLSGGTAILYGKNHIIAAGGVNRTIFEDAISGTYNCIPQKEYMRQPAEWYRFNNRLMLFDTKSEQWSIAQRSPLYARAGALLTTDGEAIYYIGGELKPGIRTPEITKSNIRLY